MLQPKTKHKIRENPSTPWNAGRSQDTADFFTIGYSGRKLEDLIDAMIQSGVRTLVDVRRNPVSMHRPEMSKSNLKRRVEESGIAYSHLPELGVPREIRKDPIDEIWNWYNMNVVAPFVADLSRFLSGFQTPIALMCLEKDPRDCHRHRLFLALESKGLHGFDL